MSKVCAVCGKRSKTGNSKSHSNVKTRRIWKPNIQRVLTETDGKKKRMYVCTTCIKSGKVKRPVKQQITAHTDLPSTV
ncbi:MAG: 50S ribosomal protein L28 [Candidatus Omnitrophica bacterium]|nr:50S ribosomal protein L28 [Candidatus Omnitrophota bacterium]